MYFITADLKIILIDISMYNCDVFYVPYGKNVGGKKLWRIDVNSPKFFSPIL